MKREKETECDGERGGEIKHGERERERERVFACDQCVYV